MSVETEPKAPASGGTRRTLPLAVYLLAFSLFAMGSAEFLLAGVLPAIADDLHITLSSAGALISAFAVGVVIGGPPLAVLTLRWRGGPPWWSRRPCSPPPWRSAW